MTGNAIAVSHSAKAQRFPEGAAVLLGRVLLSLSFVFSGFNHFSKQTIAFAASQGVPLASIAVPFSGILAIVGGLSIVFGYGAKIGAWLIVLFLVPVTFMMHKFWAVTDPMAAGVQMIMFMKNISILGGALLISQLGAGPLSIDNGHSQ